MFAKVHGAFKSFSGRLEYDEKSGDFTGARATIDAASVDTGEAKRDEHLRSPDFFDAARFATLRFESTRVEKHADGYILHGDLTIRDVTRKVALTVESLGRVKDPWGQERAGFTGVVTIDRKEFGIVWNQTLDLGGVALGEKVEIHIDVQAIAKQAEVPAADQARAPAVV
jgi:polyisoprenoid-binding protein YceI